MRPLPRRLGLRTIACGLLLLSFSSVAVGQGTEPEPAMPLADTTKLDDELQPPRQVEVEPHADDQQIAARLQRILEATDWFHEPRVRVDEGVVFLSGSTTSEEHRQWARNLALRTRDVVAVVNRIEVVERPLWDLSPAFAELRDLWRRAIQISLLVVFALLVLVIFWFAARFAAALARRVFHERVSNRLLREVAAKTLALLVFILGLYLVLRISGLTRLALTVVGGTGVVGIIVGIAFRDIAENFLASILISMQNPFQTGDLIEVAGYEGFVQRVTTRGTVLIALDGTYIQIPNSTIYKSTIRNTTANPKNRQEFTIGISYDDPIAYAQEVALRVLREHPTVLDDPEPLVLVEGLGTSTVNLRVLFWINSNAYSMLRVRSSVMRLVKRAFQDAAITLPDEAREVIFPKGVPLAPPGDGHPHPAPPPKKTADLSEDEQQVSTAAEGDLRNEADEIEAQARQSRMPEQGEDLLAPKE